MPPVPPMKFQYTWIAQVGMAPLATLQTRFHPVARLHLAPYMILIAPL
jgi:hypothetical protein